MVKKYYNGAMITLRGNALWRILILVLTGFTSCAGAPEIEKSQFSQRHYTYSILLVPEMLGNSPLLEVAISLLHMEYPADKAKALHDILYGQIGYDAYKDFIISEQRRNYRSRAGDLPTDGSGTAGYNWRYAEKFNIKKVHSQGMVIERELETYYGGAHPGRNTQFYIIEMEGTEFRQLTLDDLFDNFQEDQQFRDIVYEELKAYSYLTSTQPLSQGIYFNNEPELTFNFFITDDGLGLHWDPAQIAPHTYGIIQIIIPWYRVRFLMLDTATETLAKFGIYL
jgi:hypothetical protein